MTKYFFIFLLITISCKQNDSALVTEIAELKKELHNVESQLSENKIDKTGFIHSVYFWLVNDITQAQRTDFIKNGMGKLKNCEHLTSIYIGPPAGTDREVVDNTYDYAWICHFKDEAAHNAYQIDPLHLAFIEKYGDLFKEVKIYDSIAWD